MCVACFYLQGSTVSETPSAQMVFEDDENDDPDHDEDERGSHKKSKVCRIHLFELRSQ